mmetsp:Transcript_19324/g.40498  ORF Transcript_19324/g.40498 Transcript_19324/m.40498 type:complete len:216 (+) Transcript_19324:677-1324(+)
MFLYQFKRCLGPNATNSIAIITPQQDTQIHKLIMIQTQSTNGLFVIKLLHIRLGRIRKRHLPHLYRRPKRQRVHILRRRGVHFPRPRQRRGLRFRLARRPDDGHSHHRQEFNAVFVLFGARTDETFGLLVLFFDVAGFFGRLEGVLGLRSFLPPFLQFTAFKLRGLSIENIYGSYSFGNEPNSSIKYSLDVRGGLTVGVREHHCCRVGTAGSHGD